MSMDSPPFINGQSVFNALTSSIESGERPIRFDVGGPHLSTFEIGPGLISIIAAPPGIGKSSLVNQFAIDAVRIRPDLRVLIANVELSPEAMVERIVSRLSNVDASSIRTRNLTSEERAKIANNQPDIAEILSRVTFARPPVTIENIANTAVQTSSRLVCWTMCNESDQPPNVTISGVKPCNCWTISVSSPMRASG